MSGGHGHAGALLVAGDSAVHRRDAAVKLAGLVCFVVAVALTPRRGVVAFVVDLTVVVGLVAVANLPWRMVLGRLAVIAPFVVFALALPVIAHGERRDVLGVSLSRDGLWSCWNILIKALIGALAGIVVSATTSVPDIVRGLERLRVPATLVAIVGFMCRYLELLLDQVARMRRSMVARCHNPRWLWQARPVAASAGALFVRSESIRRCSPAATRERCLATTSAAPDRGRGSWRCARPRSPQPAR